MEARAASTTPPQTMAAAPSRPSQACGYVADSERAARQVRGVDAVTPLRAIASAGVVGAGTMGRGIAMAFADAGIPVALLETDAAALDRAMASIRQTYEGQVRRGRTPGKEAARRLVRIRPTLDYADFAGADLAIEAVFERMDVKAQVFGALDRVMKPGAILASNTSALDLDTIAALTSRPQDVVGLHFFSPAHLMRLLEIVRGAKTAPDVLATALALAATLGKVPVVAGVCDGFIGNRILARYQPAANDMVARGAAPQQVDEALQAFGIAMGPLRMGDLAGLDIGWAGRKRRTLEHPGQDFSMLADRLCEAGRFGQKTGAGWYRYEPGSRTPLPDPAVAHIVARWRADKGLAVRTFSDAEVVERCVYAMVNEGARIVADGIAQRASDIDVVYRNGYGFPAQRGGPMRHADDVGLPEVVRALERFAAEPGADAAFWAPAPLLAKLAACGGRLT